MSYTFEQIGNGIIFNGDCLDVMPELINQGIKVDAIITDIPYGTTACKWDNVIPFEPMWECLKGLIKDNGAICLFGCEPFSSQLRYSNLKMYKYDWIWEKDNGTGFQLANCMPLKCYENISVFSYGVTYPNSNKKMIYNPQGLKVFNKRHRRGSKGRFLTSSGCKEDDYIQKYTNYPRNVLKFKCEKGFHPTQKPISLMEYLIKTYTNENEVVLDFTMGSGTTGVACKNLHRKFIGIELDKSYYEIAKKRIEDTINKYL